ncbi:hypothetical protein Tsubulata_015211, partial [Turnera subulata]
SNISKSDVTLSIDDIRICCSSLYLSKSRRSIFCVFLVFEAEKTTMMLAAKHEWLEAAMTDDTLVAELLFRLKQAHELATPAASSVAIPLRWGRRLPRSRHGVASAGSARCDVGFGRRKDKEGGDSSTRCSPTTPLSWSSGGGGSASPSTTADGFEVTSRQTNLSAVRSKDVATAEAAYTATKRSRKKKTFSELKEEESSLLKESLHLKKEIATLRTTFKEHAARNVNLKKMKLDLNVNSDPSKRAGMASHEAEKSICSQSLQTEAPSISYPSLTFRTQVKDDIHPLSESCKTDKETSNHDRFFLLPDLNMMPSEEDSGSEAFCGRR